SNAACSHSKAAPRRRRSRIARQLHRRTACAAAHVRQGAAFRSLPASRLEPRLDSARGPCKSLLIHLRAPSSAPRLHGPAPPPMTATPGKPSEPPDSASGRSAPLPVRAGTIGPAGLDITHLQPELDVFTYDPGFGMTAATESRITYIDGDAGVL